MNKKKFLLMPLLTIALCTLLRSEGDDITLDNSIMSITQPMSQAEENDITLEQRFLCEQKGNEGGVVCQMYECLDGECQEATAIKNSEDEDFVIQGKKDSSMEKKTFDFDDYEILCPVVGRQESSEEESTYNRENTSDNELMSNIDVSYSRQDRIKEFKREIRQAEERCERAETDPLEKEICERASAKVQLRKKQIKELENR